MHTSTIQSLAVAAVLMSTSLACSRGSTDSQQTAAPEVQEPLRLGVLPAAGRERTQEIYSALTAEISDALHRPVVLRIAADYDALLLIRGRYDGTHGIITDLGGRQIPGRGEQT